ncbi:MAG: ABC transporter ATP-binding protein, partial [bacterium]
MNIISVKNVGKAYKQYASNRDRLVEWFVPFSGDRHHLHWILQDINFDIGTGESVGMVGANGAGKSTLLKMITGTTQVSAGSISTNGDIAALLELGMGFHQEFTGRQNVYMAGQLRGLSIEEIDALMPEIEAFAEIGEYIDQQVRVYSSGMQVRLAFSVATAKRPSVLIVDEALSVGDAYFQHKSFKRIREFRNAGTTLLIVTHDRSAIQTLCDRAILLDGGRLAREGDPEEVMDFYNALMAEKEQNLIKQEMMAGRVQTVSGTGEVSFGDIALLNEAGQSIEMAEVAQPVVLQVKAKVNQPVPRLVLGFMIKDRYGQPIHGINTHRLEQPLEDMKPGEEVVYRFKFDMNLGKGHYSISFSLCEYDSHLETNYAWIDGGFIFHVINKTHPDFVGCTWLESGLSIDRI